MNDTLPELLTLESATRAFDLSRWTLERAIERGELQAELATHGSQTMKLLRRADVRAWKEARG